MALASRDNPPDCGDFIALAERRPYAGVAFTPFGDVTGISALSPEREASQRDGAFLGAVQCREPRRRRRHFCRRAAAGRSASAIFCV